MKVTILLEQPLAVGVSGADYNAWLIDIYKRRPVGSGSDAKPIPFCHSSRVTAARRS